MQNVSFASLYVSFEGNSVYGMRVVSFTHFSVERGGSVSPKFRPVRRLRARNDRSS